MTAISILIINTLVSFHYILKRNTAFLAYVIFFQHIQILLFYDLGIENYHYIYFAFLLLVFIAVFERFRLYTFKFVSPVMISIYLILLIFYIHYVLIGIEPENVKGFGVVHDFLLMNVPIMISIILVVSKTTDFEAILSGIVIYGIIFIMTLIFVADIHTAFELGRKGFRETYRISPLLAARTAGIIAIAAGFLYFNTNKLEIKIASISAFLLSIYTIGITASRGPLIFLVLTVLIYMLIRKERLGRKVFIIALCITVFIATFLVLLELDLLIVDRLQRLENYERMRRYTRIFLAYDLLRNPDTWIFGLGPHGFGYETQLGYPHNLFIELLVEYGFFGLISALIILIYGLYCFVSIVSSDVYVKYHYIALIFLYNLLCSQTSGNIVFARHTFFSAILLSILHNILKREHRSKRKNKYVRIMPKRFFAPGR